MNTNILDSLVQTSVGPTIHSPIDVIKIRLQCQPEMLKSGILAQQYTGPTNCFMTMRKQEGNYSFFKGNLTNIIKSFSNQGLSFYFHHLFKNSHTSNPSQNKYMFDLVNFLKGGLAGMCSMSITYPLEYARTRLINDIVIDGKKQFNNLLEVFTKTYKTDGLQGFFRGFMASIFSVFLYRGLYFGGYDLLKRQMGNNFIGQFFIGFGVTVMAGLLVYPIDTVRRRMMMTSCETDKYKGATQCLMIVLKNEGIRPLFGGCGINIVFGIGSSIALVFYDNMFSAKKQNY